VRGASFDEAADLLVNPVRDPTAAQASYVPDPDERRKVIGFPRSLETDERGRSR
jgi:hypothetical protein